MDSASLANMNLLSPDVETPAITPVPTPVSGSVNMAALVSEVAQEKQTCSKVKESCWTIMLQVKNIVFSQIL